MNGTIERKTNYIYIEYLRVISALAVIVIHVSGANWFRIGIGSADWVTQTFFNLGGRFSVCVFCMISGALLLRPDREYRMREVFSRYIRRILICFAAWTVLYALLYTAIEHGDFRYFLTRLFKLPDHLWYLLMLIGLYLVLPAMRALTRDRALTRWLIWLLIAFGTLDTVSGITGFFSEAAGDSWVWPLWKGFLGNLSELERSFVPGYFGLFLLGHYIHEYGLGSRHRLIVCAAVPALILSGLLTVWISLLTGKYVYTFMLETNPLIVLASAGIFAFFREKESALQEKSARSAVPGRMVWLGSSTFGIYLIHFAVREIFSKCFGFSVASYPAVLSVPLNTLLIFLISLALTALFRKVPGLKRIVT